MSEATSTYTRVTCSRYVMMVTTHALAGILLAGTTLILAPEYAPVAVVAASVGGVFPDLDLYAEHRKTLHYPVYYSALAAVGFGLVAVAPSDLTLGLAFFVLAAALHSSMDVLGGGLELRPWRGVSERAVYDHYRNRWLRPRRWVRYDGAPEDLLLAVALGIPSLVVYSGAMRRAVVVLLVVSAFYTLVRKPLVCI